VTALDWIENTRFLEEDPPSLPCGVCDTPRRSAGWSVSARVGDRVVPVLANMAWSPIEVAWTSTTDH